MTCSLASIRQASSALLLGLAAPACSGGTNTDTEVPVDPAAVCSGGDGLALAYATFPTTATLSLDDDLTVRNGYRYIYVDRSCEYWVNSVPEQDGVSTRNLQHTRTGTLSTAELRELLADLRYASWSRMAGPAPASGTHDAPIAVLTDGARFVQCIASCRADVDGPSVSPGRTAALEAAARWLDRLVAAPGSRPIAGSARVLVQDWSTADPDYAGRTATWPLEQPLEDFLVTFDPGSDQFTGPLQSRVDPPDAEILRALRERQVSGELNPWWVKGPTLPVTIPGRRELFNLTVSDELPFERPEGGVAIWNLPEDQPLAP